MRPRALSSATIADLCPSLVAMLLAGAVAYLHRGEDHCSDCLPEVAAAIDCTKAVRPDGLMSGIDHGLGRRSQRFQRRLGKTPVSGSIDMHIAAIWLGNRLGYLVEHGPRGGGWLLWHGLLAAVIEGCWTSLKCQASLSSGPLLAEQTAILKRAPTCCDPYAGTSAAIPKYG
jgi:hypothetical protein